MPSAKPLLKRDIEYAQANTRSHAEAARYLNVSFTTYKKYTKAYLLYDTNFKNKAGKGITKSRKNGSFGLDDILAGKYPKYDRYKLKIRLLRAGYLQSQCHYCGHTKTRPDGKGPFKLEYLDGDENNLTISNLAIICYNCLFLITGHIGEISLQRKDYHHYDSDYDMPDNDLAALRDELFGVANKEKPPME
jgi:hypothetical protein